MGHDHDRLDQLVDTDPIELRDQAYTLLARAEQAEATIERIRAYIDPWRTATITSPALRELVRDLAAILDHPHDR